MPEIRIITSKVSRAELQKIADERYGDMVKAVVDCDKKIMAVGGELHADEEAILLQNGSRQADLWGVNLYPQKSGADFIEFDSVINLRPAHGNRSRGIDDSVKQETIRQIADSLVE